MSSEIGITTLQATPMARNYVFEKDTGGISHWFQALAGQVGQLPTDVFRQILPGAVVSKTVVKLTQIR